MNGMDDNQEEYLFNVDYYDEDLIDEEFVADVQGYGKNYNMLHQLIVDAGSNYIEEEGLTKLQYYLKNLARVDPLKSFIDDQNEGLLWETLHLMADDSPKTEAILRYIVHHKNVAFHQENVVQAACRSQYIFFQLIKAGGNVHYKSYFQFTALHFAVLGNRTNIIKYLLDQNVDVNCYNENTYTALHYAFKCNYNLDIIELLIRNGADLYLRNRDSLTPLEYAISIKQFNNVCLVLNSRLTENIISFDLLLEVFSCFCRLYSENSEEFQNDFFGFPKPQAIIGYYDFFKQLCEKLIKYFIANKSRGGELPILSIYLNNNIFESKDWSNALTFLLTSEIASILLEECLYSEKESIYALLIPKLLRAKVELEDRMDLLKLLLFLNMVPNLKDMALILAHYGFNEEFQLLNLSLPDHCLLNNCIQEDTMEYIASVFCGLETNLDYNRIFAEQLPEKFYDYIKQYFTPTLSNCSSNAYYRNSEINLPNILSLQELSRNSVRKLIRRNKILSPRDFITTVNSLSIPVKCKNYILLKSKIDKYYR